jgi:Chromo (CHRromatin Organisation MOdifier) domain
MPSSRRRNRAASEDQEQQQRKNPRRGGKKAVSYASLDDDEDNKIDEEVSDVEVLSEVEDDFLDDDMEDEVEQTRRSARVAKKDTEAYGERRVSTRANKATGNMDEASEDDFDTDGDSSNDSAVKETTKAPTKTSARPSKNRLNVDSEYVQEDEEDDDGDDDDDDDLIIVEAPKAKKKKKEVKPQPTQEYEPFRISKIIAAMTLPLSQWKEVCREMNTSEITVGSRWFQDDDDKDDSQEETRFLIKWSDASYCHCSWETENDLVNLIEKAKVSIKTFLAKCDDDGKIFKEDARNDGEYFDPAWLQVDRILEVHFPKGHSGDERPEHEIQPEDVGIIMDMNDEDYENALGRQFMVKWGSLPYSESSFEFERDLILCGIPYKDKVTEFNKRRTKTDAEIRQKQHDDGEAELRRLYLEVFGEKSESKLKDGVEVFQKALRAHEYPNGGQLRDYQAEGVSWLIANFLNKRSCILADEMGKSFFCLFFGCVSVVSESNRF